MANLKQLMEQIITKKVIANKRYQDEIHPHIRGALKSQAVRAKEDLKQLTFDYRNAVRSNCAFILVNGASADKFAEISSSEFQCFSIDGNKLYNLLLENIDPRLYVGRPTGSSLFDIVSSNFEGIASDIGIVGFPPLTFTQKYKKNIKDKEDLLDLVTRAFNEKIGAEASAFYAIDQASKNAIDNDFTGVVLPICIHSTSEELIKEFATSFRAITKNVFIVTTGTKPSKEIKDMAVANIKSINNEEVEKTLVSIKEKL